MTDKKCIVKYQRFIDGMKERGFTIEDINKFKYCGGLPGHCKTPESHVPYFHNYFKYKTPPRIPPPDCICVCKHPIMNCCLITRDDYNLIVCGNCCIKHFIGGRTCDRCSNTHKNQKNNICNECRTTLKSLFSELKKKHREVKKRVVGKIELLEKARDLEEQRRRTREKERKYREKVKQEKIQDRQLKLDRGFRVCLGYGPFICTGIIDWNEPKYKVRCMSCWRMWNRQNV